MRVYWPEVVPGRLARCPDSFHKRGSAPITDETRAEQRFTTVNVHARPERLASRQKARARRHKDAQAKDKR